MQIKSTPLARAMAKKLNINIVDVKGSGIGGRILVEDVKNFNPAASAPASAPSAKPAVSAPQVTFNSNPLQSRQEPITPIRKAIAKAMTNSWNNVAYVNLIHRVNMTKLWDLRASIKDTVLKTTGVKLTFLPYIAKAVAIALKEFPIFTAKYNEAAGTIDYPDTVNLGIAVDTPAGLMVPVVKHAHTLGVLELANQISTLAKAARERTIKSADMQGAGFSITNYGSVGSLYGVPVINWPELGILGIGAIVDEAFVKNGAVVAGKAMYLTVAADHRWIDGATIGRFASRIAELLENPEILGVY
ncbi:pyruvate dehydrogenase E2 component (dihydrolipoamide acetyltransferase) [Mycoplasmopsis californica]|uniref:2-oxo acid dehydrogenase subunit E2 n=1 Tax=Mycoplasmopsis equigenitalium TaxID=114883 RepID=A0ABY5J5I3_9BACT|nr:2-oxo acid dehydrogenase subunit E2 [Mycoplasmopsis equigenitalium]UUD37225.1 2-oxo acid dehydrogenase subunit E2 [Mycoplasmopsis equigenitalium]VEU69469.1 pyruvate dehydrogenase E2 component (dihydrolipoamide acetyltransferase) [Mycoplasmopsis californica]